MTIKRTKEENALRYQQRKAQGKAGRSGKSGKSGSSGKSGKKKTFFDDGYFIGLDGEGIGFGDLQSFTLGEGKKEQKYEYYQHRPIMLVASTGDCLLADRATLTGKFDAFTIMDFLLGLSAAHPWGIFTIFRGSYDVTQWFKNDLSKDEVKAFHKGTQEEVDGKVINNNYFMMSNKTHRYRIQYRQNKSLSITRWDRRDRTAPPQRFKLWDVWGFFQDSFVGVMRKWLTGHPEYERIKSMKAERENFSEEWMKEGNHFEETLDYCRAEVSCLAAVMDNLRQSFRDVGIKVSMWHGSGAIAVALMAKHGVKQHLSRFNPVPIPDAVKRACQCAYTGGHIEMMKIGYHDGIIHHYDINSAYPYWIAQLSSLVSGVWKHNHREATQRDFSLIKVRYSFPPELSFYPLFFRDFDGNIRYPKSGSGWYWTREYRAACRFAELYGGTIEILESWSFISSSEDRPFAWVTDVYHERQRLVEEAKRTGIPSGAEKTLKGGMNSLYGKLLQQIGAIVDDDGSVREPAYFELAWAGFITAGCRAQLMEAAIQDMPNIISFATDGIFSMTPLDLDCPKTKELGKWEYTQHTGMTSIMPGVYFLHDNEKIENKTRGFGKMEELTVWDFHTYWKARGVYSEEEIPVVLRRMITLPSASVSEKIWAARGCFATGHRMMNISGSNSKRWGLGAEERRKLHKGMQQCKVRNIDLMIDGTDESQPYEIGFWWLGDNEGAYEAAEEEEDYEIYRGTFRGEDAE